MLNQHVYLVQEDPLESPERVCYYVDMTVAAGGLMIGEWVGFNLYEWCFDQKKWYTFVDSGLPNGNMTDYSTGSPIVVPEQEAAELRSKLTVGELQEDRGNVRIYSVCEYI